MYKVIVDDTGTMFSIDQNEAGNFVCVSSDRRPPTLFNVIDAAQLAEDMNKDLDFIDENGLGSVYEFIDRPVGKFVAVFVNVEKVKFLPGGIDVNVH